jgi:ArsR family transcriptional regulator
MKNAKEFQRCAERLRALADADRLRIVQCLFEGERNVGEIAELLKEDIAKVSHHLGVLWHAKIVSRHRAGRFVVYRLHPNVAFDGPDQSGLRVIELGCCRVDLAGR